MSEQNKEREAFEAWLATSAQDISDADWTTQGIWLGGYRAALQAGGQEPKCRQCGHAEHPGSSCVNVAPAPVGEPADATHRHKFTGELRAFDPLDDSSECWVPVEAERQGNDDGKHLLREQMQRTIEAQDECSRLRAELAELRASTSPAALTGEARRVLGLCVGPLNIAMAMAGLHSNANSADETAKQCQDALDGIRALLAAQPAEPAPVDRQGVALSEAAVIGVVELEVVIDEDGFPVWCAAVPNACQEHIKDAVEREIFGAEKWVVRSYIRHPGYLAPQPAVEPVELGEFRIHPCQDAAFGYQYDVVATSSQHAMLATMGGAKLYIVGDSIRATMQDAWQEGYRAGIEKGRKDQAVHEKHYLAGFNAARASSSRAEVESKDA